MMIGMFDDHFSESDLAYVIDFFCAKFEWSYDHFSASDLAYVIDFFVQSLSGHIFVIYTAPSIILHD